VAAGALIEVETREGVREAVAAGFGVGVVFESEFGADRRFHPLRVSDADLAVGEYAVCMQQRRAVEPVRGFFDVAARLATRRLSSP
jgi:DNA-binding transcriptional LysR family regulator